MKGKIIGYIRRNWVSVAVGVIFCVAVFSIVSVVWGIRAAIGAGVTWVSVALGIARRKKKIKSAEKESAADREGLDKEIRDLVQGVEESDKEIDKQIKDDAREADTPAQDKADVLSILEELKKGD